MLIDTHAHLDDKRFEGDMLEVLRRAAESGVERVIAVGTTAASSRACIDLAIAYPMLSPSIGIHPNIFAAASPRDWDVILELSAHPRVVALGETGLDRHWNDTPFEAQEFNFVRHLELSRSTGLPLVIHSRECDADMIRVLRQDFDSHGPINGVMHSFSGGPAFAETCMSMGLFLSFAGMVTYKNAAAIRGVAASAPADRIMVETDCPYLSPQPVRGRRNEPAFVIHTARCVAEARGVSFEHFAAQSTRNARKLFHRLPA